MPSQRSGRCFGMIRLGTMTRRPTTVTWLHPSTRYLPVVYLNGYVVEMLEMFTECSPRARHLGSCLREGKAGARTHTRVCDLDQIDCSRGVRRSNTRNAEARSSGDNLTRRKRRGRGKWPVQTVSDMTQLYSDCSPPLVCPLQLTNSHDRAGSQEHLQYLSHAPVGMCGCARRAGNARRPSKGNERHLCANDDQLMVQCRCLLCLVIHSVECISSHCYVPPMAASSTRTTSECWFWVATLSGVAASEVVVARVGSAPACTNNHTASTWPCCAAL